MPLEISWGFSPGKVFRVFPAAFGGLAAPVCMDATYYETFRVVAALGADIVAVPIANPEEYNAYLALRGIWPRVQETPVYGIKSALVGKMLGFTLTGRRVIAPGADAERRRGPGGSKALTGKNWLRLLDLAALLRLRTTQLMDNPEFMSNIFPGLSGQRQVRRWLLLAAPACTSFRVKVKIMQPTRTKTAAGPVSFLPAAPPPSCRKPNKRPVNKVDSPRIIFGMSPCAKIHGLPLLPRQSGLQIGNGGNNGVWQDKRVIAGCPP